MEQLVEVAAEMTMDGDKPKENPPQNVSLVGGTNLAVDDSDSDDEPVVDMEDYVEDDDPVSLGALLESESHHRPCRPQSITSLQLVKV